MTAPTDKKCGAKLKSGGTCRNRAGYRTDHDGYGRCYLHLGATRALRLSAAKEEALEVARKLSDEIDMNPLDAMLWCVRLSAGAVSFYRQMADEVGEQLGTGEEWEGEGLEDMLMLVNGLGKLYGEERDRLAKTSAMCIQAGLAERQVRLAEQQGDLLAALFTDVLGELGLPARQVTAAKKLAAQKLLAIPATAREIDG